VVKRIFLLFVLLLLAVVPSVLADSVDQEIDKLITHAEQYELGNINYVELTLYSSITRSRINSILGEVDFEHNEGLTAQAAKSYFGTPQGYTKWVWSSSEDNEVRTDEPVPYFERIVFDGLRIQITFNAWPHYYKNHGENILYYWTDFDVRFKKQIDIDTQAMLIDITQSVEGFSNGVVSAEELITKTSDYEHSLRGYFEQNRENCKNILSDLFTGEYELRKEDSINWKTEFYSGDNLDVELTTKLQNCDEDCNWPWIDMWLNPEFFSHDQHWESSDEYFEPEMYEGYSIEDLEFELKKTLQEALLESKRVDNGDSTWSAIDSYAQKINVILRALSEKYYDGQHDHSEPYEERKAALSSILSEFGGYEVETVFETSYEKTLFTNQILRQNAWCQQVSQETCDIREDICVEGACTNAISGNEICNNNIDDDGDTVADCDDPDCAKECGRYCESVCQESGCWECTGECNNLCDTGCWDCDWDNDPEGCNAICESSGCNSCNDACYDSEICSDCNSCNSEIYDYEESTSDACYEGCDLISSSLAESDLCYSMCSNNVAFYCNGAKQYTPCLDIDYICDGKIQNIPCTIYTCGDLKQTEPCGTVDICGENKKLEGNICVCADGYYDCNGDGTCSSTISCDQEQEICSDGIDNDENDETDCSDYSACNLKSCGDESICYEGLCQLEDDISFCEAGQSLLNGICVNSCKFDEDCGESQQCSHGVCIELTECTLDLNCFAYKEVCVDNVCSELVCEEGFIVENKVCVESIEEVGVGPIKTGEHCVVASDCSGDNNICSNGLCKEIPQENIDNLIEGGLIGLGAPIDNIEETIEEVTAELAKEIQEVPEVTGFASFLTGFVTGFAVEDAFCKDNQFYDDYSGNCWCESGYFSCDDDWDGNDATGCESTDATCGGEREICGGGCGESQYCDEALGHCQCEEGTYDCDGAWWDCESTVECSSCASNDDCAGSSCDLYNPSQVVNFGCFQGNSWTEELGLYSFSGSCQEHPNGQIDGWVGFNFWGEPFDDLHELRQEIESELGDSWCEWELENALKQRKEIQLSLESGDLEWFQTKIIEESPNDWEDQVSAIYDMYWNIVENNRRLAESSTCLGEDFPDLEPLTISGVTSLSEIEIWEEEEYVSEFGLIMLTPYMKVWIFPPQDLIKQEMQDAAAEGRWPGDGGEEGGPSPEELEEMRSSPEAMEFIRDLVSRYDDSILNANFKIADNGEDFFNVDIRISEENLIQVKPVAVYEPEADITVEIDFEWMYSFIELQEKRPELEHPEWSNKDFSDMFDDTITTGLVAGKVTSGIATRKIKVSPISELPTAMILIEQMFKGD
jgi:hypothetical protein